MTAITFVASSAWAAPLVHLWQSTLFAGVVGLLALSIRKNRAQARYWLWLIASVKFLVPFSLLVGIGRQLSWPIAAVNTQPRFSFLAQEFTQPFSLAKQIYPVPPAPAAPVFTSHFLPTLLLVIWFCGCAGVVFIWWLRWRRITAAVRGASPMQAGRELDVLHSVERREGITGRTEVIVSECTLEPGIVGIFRPVMLLPAGLTERLTDRQLWAIMAHELCHIRRRDNLAASVHMLVEAIFWFHPLVWWIGGRLVDERERACDEEVLRLGSEPQVYAEGILAVCEFCLESPLACAAGVTGSNLKKRVERIMTCSYGRNLGFGRKLLLTAMGAISIIGPFSVGFANPASNRAESQPAPSGSATFEAVTIRTSGSEDRSMGIGITRSDGHWEFTARSETLNALIGHAYNLNRFRISGGPTWTTSKRYDINARMPDSGKNARMADLGKEARLDLQNFLAERFKLTLHRETKKIPVYELVVGDNGPKLNEVPPARVVPSQSNKMIISPPGHLVAKQATTAALARALSVVTGRLVLDETGLKGFYDFTLDWRVNPGMPMLQGAPSPASVASILSAIPAELGLELKSQRSPVEVLVVDHATEVTGKQ
ncbi:MAG: TIGR03435 family protein [Candidatus Acidiferrales bacterium]